MTEQPLAVTPTVIVRDREGDETFGFVTANVMGEDEALIVFRGPEDAFAFQAHTGRCTPEEGYRVIGMDHRTSTRSSHGKA